MICCGTNELRVEADIGADPIWCNSCLMNLNLEDIAISKSLKQEMMDWVQQYGGWIDWKNEGQWVPNGLELERLHNEHGERLTEKVKQELGPKYKVVFSKSAYGWTP
ncbi:hypothetical protein [Ornithinibacillus halophilus]|uniref:Uncharacterized protein n=1 Tax=Ornithinibacillus halophilus TaxID=930117 RepID=A0A1M5KKL5_9BACI|nr:hypothetical protein [Ornithinibacillus halophilus]SHG52713.1 hypothetical protein SAMN05216225_10393 [Ornithinibacillus halophilus]